MDADNLIHMANRIGEFFQSMPDREDATTGVAEHIHRFWEPRMRRALLSHVDTTQGAGLLPVVAEALALHRSELA